MVWKPPKKDIEPLRKKFAPTPDQMTYAREVIRQEGGEATPRAIYKGNRTISADLALVILDALARKGEGELKLMGGTGRSSGPPHWRYFSNAPVKPSETTPMTASTGSRNFLTGSQSHKVNLWLDKNWDELVTDGRKTRLEVATIAEKIFGFHITEANIKYSADAIGKKWPIIRSSSSRGNVLLHHTSRLMLLLWEQSGADCTERDYVELRKLVED
jgi:hypothetical protein